MVKQLIASILFTLLVFGHCSGQTTNTKGATAFDKSKLFDEVSGIVAEHFYDQKFDVGEWDKRAKSFRERALKATTHDEFANEINSMLATLNASHTYYFSKLNPKRYQLLGVFHQMYDPKRTDLFVYSGVGIDTRVVDGRVYVSAVYDGHPAARAGLQFGDLIRSVDNEPFHPIHSFIGKEEKTARFSIERAGKALTVDVEVEQLDGREMFQKALDESARVIEFRGKRIGYLHVWSYAGTHYQETVRAMILWGKLSKCDSLVLDLRDGWGGADINYLNLFRKPIANIKAATRKGVPSNYTGVWGKQVALITNGGSTSGKELFSYGFKKLKLGKIFGENTAGAVVGGRGFLLSNGDLLYLAVTDVSVDGVRLEGQGVAPDVKVKRDLSGGGEGDPQLQRALEHLAGDGEK